MGLLQNMITINKVIYVSLRVHEEELSSFTAMLVYFISIGDIEDSPPTPFNSAIEIRKTLFTLLLPSLNLFGNGMAQVTNAQGRKTQGAVKRCHNIKPLGHHWCLCGEDGVLKVCSSHFGFLQD